ncbi:SDR family oxidoreductase [Caballeronia sp. GAWG2-1]|uniref:SDR family oxidoreductase n=1 Tax=Caballeronia sp. GAWG2-1 TaxID=2921744 RepID=UPI0020276F96|nr:SDR family oxidoreductase [Caballeronia sp. GAWG2-1]
MTSIQKVLVIGATGSVGRLVVDELVQRNVAVRIVVRNPVASEFPTSVDIRSGNISEAQDIAKVLEECDAVIFTHGANGTEDEHESVDYGAVRNVLFQAKQPIRIALMTAIGVTDHTVFYNLDSKVHDWKRRSERLVPASGFHYTIVRPAWFDLNAADRHHLVFIQGDRRSSGTPDDGVIARQQIAQVLVESLFTESANRKTFELVAEKGEDQTDLAPLFEAMDADASESIDGVRDQDTLPNVSKPVAVRADLGSVSNRSRLD